MHAAQSRERSAAIDRLDERRRERQREIRFAVSNLLREFEGWPRIDIADIGKSLRAQQLLGNVLRRDADAGDLHNTARGRFQRSFRGQHARRADKAGGAGQ